MGRKAQPKNRKVYFVLAVAQTITLVACEPLKINSIESDQAKVIQNIVDSSELAQKDQARNSDELTSAGENNVVNIQPDGGDIRVGIHFGDKKIKCSDKDKISKRAGEGNPEAQFQAGLIYYQGVCVGRSLALAFNWFHAAALQRHADAYYNTGFMMHKSLGSGKNDEKIANGLEIIKHLAGQGYPLAMAYLDEIDYQEVAKEDVESNEVDFETIDYEKIKYFSRHGNRTIE